MKMHFSFLIALYLAVQAQAQYNIDCSKSFEQLQSTHSIIQQFRTENIFFWEDFETGQFPPVNWTVVQHNPHQTWKQGTSQIMPPMSGQYFAICRYDETYDTLGQDEKLCLPVLDLTGLNDATLSFWFVFSKFWGIKPNDNYDLQVIISTDGGNTYTGPVWTELSTDTAIWNSWEWVRAEVNLTPYIGQTQLQICFRYVGFDGADAAIDDVAISFVTSTAEHYEPYITFYPNPVRDVIFINAPVDLSHIRIFTTTGIEVMHLNENLHNINISDLPSGMYILRCETHSGTPQMFRFLKIK